MESVLALHSVHYLLAARSRHFYQQTEKEEKVPIQGTQQLQQLHQDQEGRVVLVGKDSFR